MPSDLSLRKAAIYLLGIALVSFLAGTASWLFFKTEHGVIVTTGPEVRQHEDIKHALADLAGHPEWKDAGLSVYLWIRNPAGMYFVVKGLGRHHVYIDSAEVRELRQTPYGIQVQPVPPGVHLVELICDPSNFAPDQYFLWTADYVEPQEISADVSYQRSLPHYLLYIDLIGQYARILYRAAIVFLILCFSVWIVIFLLRKVELLPQHPSERPPRVLPLLLLLMLGLRVWGISYQLVEGLHPDERMVQNNVSLFRAGDLKPRQYFWSPGYEYLAAAGESTASWILGHDVPPHLVARLLSAGFSWLSCLVLFSLARKLSGSSVGFWAALFLGFGLMPIEIAHQGIVESTMVFAFLLAFRILLELDASKRDIAFVVAGMVAGVAVGIKQSAAVLLIPTVAYFAIMAADSRKGMIRKSIFWAIGAAAGFILVSPYTLLDFPRYLAFQKWQAKSQAGLAGSRLFFVDDPSLHGRLLRIVSDLVDGMSLPVVVLGICGVPLLIWRFRKNALILVPVTVVYFAMCVLGQASPYHYVLLLCPLLAIFAAELLVFVARKLPRSRYSLPAIGLLLLSASFMNVFKLEKTLAGTDTRRVAEAWCNRNLPKEIRVDYEMFGPRFLMPFWNTFRLPLLDRDTWSNYVRYHHPQFYVYDEITASIFTENPELFPVESEWFRSLKINGKIVKDFPGEDYRLYNPELIVYELDNEAVLSRLKEDPGSVAQPKIQAEQSQSARPWKSRRIGQKPKKYRHPPL